MMPPARQGQTRLYDNTVQLSISSFSLRSLCLCGTLREAEASTLKTKEF
ncbi:hypothetical protein [Nostoc sp.]